ncbi:MAG: DUF2207 domain-containing protein [Microbacterium sp.]
MNRMRAIAMAVVAGALGALMLAGLFAAQASTAPSTSEEPVAAAAAREPAAVAAVPSGLDDFTFDSFDADYTLTRADDGTSRLRVVETIVAVFPETDQNHGIRRAMPDTFKDQPLRAHLESITDENGTPRPSEIEDVDGEFSVVSRADGYVHGRQTYVITYTLQNVTFDYLDSGLEFFWDVNGVGWAQPFGSVTARLHLDAELAGALTGRMACFQGYQGATDACGQIARADEGSGGAVITATAQSLAPYQTLTMAVGFAPGTFAAFDGSYFASPFGWLQVLAGLGVVGGAVLAVRARRRPLADEPGRPTIIAEYDPPAAVDALESAVLLGRKNKAIPAEVLEQSVVGSIRILESEGGWFSRPKLTAELVDPARADGDGRMLLDGLFPTGQPGEQYTFGRQDSRFSSAAQGILAAADRELTTRGLRRTVPRGTRLWPVLLTALSAVLVFVFGSAAVDRGVHGFGPLALIVASAILVVTVLRLVSRRPLSALGADTRDHLRGLEEFIGWAEADRIRMLQSPSGAERVPVDVNDPRQKLDLYEKLLPYAVVFGQEKEWSRQLAVLYTTVGASGPYWFAGTGGFDASSFSAGIGSLSSAASSSSSTGGTGGGGSAGGGGGGGGGGGV